MAVSPAESDHISCAILVGDYDSDICFDIAGESTDLDVPLIGYDCTGKSDRFRPLNTL